jgi:hypothetical protein
MWNVKTKVIPVIIGATGTISKSFRKYVSNIPGKHEVKKLQKTAILGTAYIRIAGTLYSLGHNLSQDISINTLHKEDDDEIVVIIIVLCLYVLFLI